MKSAKLSSTQQNPTDQDGGQKKNQDEQTWSSEGSSSEHGNFRT